jgi:hypothetical protein
MVLIVKDAKRSNVCVEMELAQKFDRFQLGAAACEGQGIMSNFDSQISKTKSFQYDRACFVCSRIVMALNIAFLSTSKHAQHDSKTLTLPKQGAV